MSNDELVGAEITVYSSHEERQSIRQLLDKYSERIESMGVEIDYDAPHVALDILLDWLVTYREQVEFVLKREAPNMRRISGAIDIGNSLQHLIKMKGYEAEVLLQQKRTARYHFKTIEAILSCDFFHLTHAERNGINKMILDITKRALIDSQTNDDSPF